MRLATRSVWIMDHLLRKGEITTTSAIVGEHMQSDRVRGLSFGPVVIHGQRIKI